MAKDVSPKGKGKQGSKGSGGSASSSSIGELVQGAIGCIDQAQGQSHNLTEAHRDHLVAVSQAMSLAAIAAILQGIDEAIRSDQFQQ